MSDSPGQSPTIHAMALLQKGQPAEAIAVMQRLIALGPGVAEHHYHLSLIFARINQREDAIRALLNATRLNPALAPAHLNLGVLLFGRGDIAAAEQSFRTAIAAGQDDEGAWRNLGKALRSQDRLDEAEQAFRTALARQPNSAEAWMMLGSVLRECGRIPEAVAATRQAIAHRPDYREAHSNLCYALYFDPRATPVEIVAEHLAWAAKFAPPLQTGPRRGLHDPIRVGYVSPYFRQHVVGMFMEPILEHHDRTQFAITCYSDTNPEDELTARLRRTDTAWRETLGTSDLELAALIKADEIDVLVDLTLHMRGCRLGVFAQKPAPTQITHLAYCGTSGLSQMDGCITDAHMIAPGSEQGFTETLLPLPTSYWCYQPPLHAPEVKPPPALENGYVTFGSLNSAAKGNDEVIRLWAEILRSVPRSRLIMHALGGRQPLLERFASSGIEANRLTVVARQSLPDYFATYNQIDIALDPFPYNGGTTTLDALWMGVPVIALAGRLPLARAGASILRNIKADHLIAADTVKYLAIATALAQDSHKLSSLRSALRNQMIESPLLDPVRYTAELEAAYRLATIQRTI